MTESNGTAEWFDDEPATVEPDEDEETEQTWFNGLAFKPTPAGEAPDTDHDLATYRPDTGDAGEIGLTVTNSARTEANSGATQTERPADTTDSGTDEATGPVDAPDTSEQVASDADASDTSEHVEQNTDASDAGPATVENVPDGNAVTDSAHEETTRDGEQTGFIAWLKSLFGL